MRLMESLSELPVAFTQGIAEIFSQHGEQVLRAAAGEKPSYLRVKPLRGNPAQILQDLRKAG